MLSGAQGRWTEIEIHETPDAGAGVGAAAVPEAVAENGTGGQRG